MSDCYRNSNLKSWILLSIFTFFCHSTGKQREFFLTDFQVEVSSMKLGTGLLYIYVLKYIRSLSFLLFSQVAAPSDSCFLNNPEQIKGFRQTNHVG